MAKKERIIALIGCVVTLFAGIFFCMSKNGMYEDEIVTFGLANSHNAPWIYDVKKLPSRDMTGTVLSNEEVMSYLTVDSGQRFDFASAYMNQTKDVHPPLYYILLNCFSSFAPGVFSKWIGLSLNLIIWILIMAFIYLSVYKVTGNSIISTVAFVSFGLSSGGLSNLLFIRMYILLSLFTIILVYQLILLKSSESKGVYIGTAACVFGGMMTQYQFLYFAVITLFVYEIYLLFNKEFKKAVRFLISVLSGAALFLISFPFFFSQISTGASGGTVSGNSVMQKAFNFPAWPKSVFNGLRTAFPQYIVAFAVFFAVLIVFASYGFYKLVYIITEHQSLARKDKNGKSNADGMLCVLTVIFVLTFCCYSILNPLILGRYYYNLMPLAAVVLGVLISKSINRIKLSENKKFKVSISVLLMTVLLSFVLILVSAPDNLYTDFGDVEKRVSKLGKSPTLYVASQIYSGVHDETLQFLKCTDDCLVVKSGSLDENQLKSYVKKHSKNEKVLIYADCLDFNRQGNVNKIMDICGYGKSEFVYSTGRTDIFVISR